MAVHGGLVLNVEAGRVAEAAALETSILVAYLGQADEIVIRGSFVAA